MRFNIKSALKDFIPPIILRIYWRWRYVHSGRVQNPQITPSDTTRNAVLKNRHAGESRCFILGNGPSLGIQDLSPLKNEVVFVCNSFNLHPQCNVMSPRYWCMADPFSFISKPSEKELNTGRDEWFADICTKAPNVQFFLPLMAREAIENKQWFQKNAIWYVNLGQAAVELNYVDDDLTSRLPWAQGTINALAIPAAIYMGFNKIYLLGCDSDWFIDNLIKKDFQAGMKHFYEQNPFMRESNIQDYGLEFWFRTGGEFFKSFRMWREFGERHGVEIYNATPGGLLDVFPRVDLKDILASRV